MQSTELSDALWLVAEAVVSFLEIMLHVEEGQRLFALADQFPSALARRPGVSEQPMDDPLGS